jgi:ATP-dependent DNA helicase PIF1
MLNFNLSVKEGLCNGAVGNVADFNKEGFPIVIFDNIKDAILVAPNDFIIEDSFTSEVLFRFTQIPLQLAYSVTIHKSQGLTFKSLKTDISKCFAYGQAYVSLSRAQSLDGLFLENFNKNAFKTNYEVVRFYKSLKY